MFGLPRGKQSACRFSPVSIKSDKITKASKVGILAVWLGFHVEPTTRSALMSMKITNDRYANQNVKISANITVL